MKGLMETRFSQNAQFIKILIWCMVPFSIIGMAYGYLLHGPWGLILGLLAAVLCSLMGSFIIALFIGSFGNLAGGLYTGRTPQWTQRELLEGDLQKVTHQKNQGNPEAAMEILDRILEKDPDFMEAVFIKAQILVENFDDTQTALSLLARIVQATSVDDQIHQRALMLQNELKMFLDIT